MADVIAPRKLIEVALPLDAINIASAREKSIRHGHPSTLHLWWARRPLAAARAVIFAQMVNDPSWKWELENPGKAPPNHLKATWSKSRRRLFKILEDLVVWENRTNEEVLERAREEIRKSWRETCQVNRNHPDAKVLFNPEQLPAFHDPFAGGGALPLEAQRLGLESFASDLNPVAVLINKAMIEIPPRFSDRRPVNPAARENRALFEQEWKGAAGLVEDVRYYGHWMRAEAEKRIGEFYPKIAVTAAMAKGRSDLQPYVGRELTVIAWLWARTVKSPNPAFPDVDVPLVSTFMLSTKDGREAYVEPVIENGGYRFTVEVGPPKDPGRARAGTKLAGANFSCLVSGTPISGDYIKSEGVEGRMGARLMAIVAEGDRGRVYLAPTAIHEDAAAQASPAWHPPGDIPKRMTGGNCTPYGLTTWGDLFTPRQLVALTTLSDLVSEAMNQARRDALDAGLSDAPTPLREGGTGAAAYAEAVAMYLALGVDKATDYNTTLVAWSPTRDQAKSTFARQALPMVWDYAEVNPFARAAGDFAVSLEGAGRFLESARSTVQGWSIQADAQAQVVSNRKVVSTDPPYYDNIGYADLSDFFYVWMRRSLRTSFPELFATMVVPKAEELVATSHRHGGREQAEAFFLNGMTNAMRGLATLAHRGFPVTIYYAFKQSETEDAAGTVSTGWETFLEAVIRAGFAISGTWPIRTERSGRSISIGTNALASSVILVCRPRRADAPAISRRQFQRELAAALPGALDDMVRGANGWGTPVAPVDLSQAIIGPGMAIYSRYASVLEADGMPLSVRTALQLINRFLAEDDFDADTQFCLHWFEQHGWEVGPFGDANTLAQAKGTSVESVRRAGVIESAGGSVRLLRLDEYPAGWDPRTDTRLPVWEALHHLIRILRTEGEAAAGRTLVAVAGNGPAMRQLAYRLYTLSERAGWAEMARAYNEVITSWSAIEDAAARADGAVDPVEVQANMFDE